MNLLLGTSRAHLMWLVICMLALALVIFFSVVPCLAKIYLPENIIIPNSCGLETQLQQAGKNYKKIISPRLSQIKFGDVKISETDVNKKLVLFIIGLGTEFSLMWSVGTALKEISDYQIMFCVPPHSWKSELSKFRDSCKEFEFPIALGVSEIDVTQLRAVVFGASTAVLELLHPRCHFMKLSHPTLGDLYPHWEALPLVDSARDIQNELEKFSAGNEANFYRSMMDLGTMGVADW